MSNTMVNGEGNANGESAVLISSNNEPGGAGGSEAGAGQCGGSRCKGRGYIGIELAASAMR